MLWKSEQDKKDWENLSDSPCPYHKLLRQFVQVVELISILTGHGELTMTSFIRLNNLHSLHYYARALDIRVKDKSQWFYYPMCLIGLALGLMNENIRMNPHNELYGKPEQHIHIEIRSRKVKK